MASAHRNEKNEKLEGRDTLTIISGAARVLALPHLLTYELF